jgi:CheY-like chemotaxis protein
MTRHHLAQDPQTEQKGSAEPGGDPGLMEQETVAAHRVLVVDDDKDVADTLAMLLECLGAETRVAYSGAAALVATDEFRPELAFLDLGMPDMDGYETARRIRLLQNGATLILAALSGWGREADRRRSMEAGFDHHFIKPIKVEALEGLLASLDD